MPEEVPAPLKGNPKRQAPGLHRGIEFQDWRSVEAWVNLKHGEALYLEGAEDFDVVGEKTATTVQTRATAAKISLRSDVVTTALLNFWTLSQQHPEKEILFHYLTTSAASEEDQPALGVGVKGLELWRETQRNGDLAAAERLRLFLIEDKKMRAKLAPPPLECGETRDESLRDFLDTATAQEVHTKLIARVKWDLQSEDSDVVRESVAMRVHAHGRTLGMRPMDCAPALDRLFRVTATTAGQEGHRLLTYADFLREFDDATQRLLPASERATQKSAADVMNEAMAGGTELRDLLLESSSLVQAGVPDLGYPVIARIALITKLVQRTHEEGILLLHGSSGMGKTKCARLVANQIGGDWIWADFQGVRAGNLPAIVRLLAANLGGESLRHVALDNLNYSSGDLNSVDTQLAAIVRLTLQRGAKIIITTQRELGARAMHKLKLTTANASRLPRLTEEEIEEFCELLGCPEEGRSKQTKFVWLQTSGHPQLVHARLAVLAHKGWPKPAAADLLGKVREIDEEKEIARQLLDQAPSGDKELLFRLSLVMGAFRRDHAIAIAQIAPALDYGADSIARLTGPWIETVGAGYFRLSPLLANAAIENWTTDKITAMRSGIAHAILKCPNKTLREADEVLIQAFSADDVDAIAAVAVNIATSPLASRQNVADALFWLPAIGRQRGTRAVKGNAFVNFLIRLSQFKIVAGDTRKVVNELCEITDREYLEDRTIPQKNSDPKKLRLMWLTSVLFEREANVAPTTLVRYWTEILELLPEDQEFSALAAKQSLVTGIPHLGGTDFSAQLLMLITARNMLPLELVEFAEAISALPTTLRKEALKGLRTLPFPLRLAIDRTWSNEVNKIGTDWGAVVCALESFQQAIADWDIAPLDGYVRRAIAAVEDEYRDNPVRAAEILAIGTTTDEVSRLLKDQRAIVHYRKQEHREAVAIWKEITPGWTVEKGSPDQLPLYACQRAANAAGRIGEWAEVLFFCKRARELCTLLEENHYSITFLADEAFARWKNGDRVGALIQLRSALEGFEKLAKNKDDPLRIHCARKMFEQLLKWIRFEAGASVSNETHEPPAGICSRIDFDEKIKDYPTAPFDLLWFFLCDIEACVHNERTIYQLAVKRIEKSPHATFRSVMSDIAVKESLRTLDLASFIGTSVRMVHALAESQAQIAAGKSVFERDAYPKFLLPDPSWIVGPAIIAGMIALTQAGRALDEFMDQWEAEAKSFDRFPHIASSIADIRRVLAATAKETTEMVNDQNQPTHIRSAAAVRVSSGPEFDLNEMFLGHAALFDYVRLSSFQSAMAGYFAEFVRSCWRERLHFSAVFPAPRITMPPIASACSDKATGLRLVARILLAARDAVRWRLPPDTLQTWQTTAQ